MNVISLFDGMGCLYISLIEAGFKINKYYASEIEKKPIEFTKKNFPDIEHLGDVIKLRHAIVWSSNTYKKAMISPYISKNTKRKLSYSRCIDWSKIDLIGGGSPCQGFSFAGKQLNFNDPSSKLFFMFSDILNHIKKLNPDVKFLLENVIMKKEYQKVINDTLGIFPVRINSNLVSAQNRDRLYWTNIKTKQVGLFGEVHSDIPQPKNEGILLKDILQSENDIDEKYYIKGNKFNLSGLDINNKAPTQRNSTGRCLDDKHNYQIIKLDKQLNIKPNQTKAGCLTTGGHSGGNHSDMDLLLIGGIKNGQFKKGLNKDFNQSARVYNIEGKSVTLSSEGGGLGAKTGLYLIQKPRGKNIGSIHKEKCPTLTSNSFEQNNILQQHFKLRRLTPIECAELQTVPKWVSLEGFSDTALYKMFGNGWTIKIIKHILSFNK